MNSSQLNQTRPVDRFLDEINREMEAAFPGLWLEASSTAADRQGPPITQRPSAPADTARPVPVRPVIYGVETRSRNQRGSQTGKRVLHISVALMVIAGLLAVIVPPFSRARAMAQKKACVSNMKTIEGATERFMMERAVAQHLSVDVKLLYRTGYLKEMPVCASGGHYAITVGSSASGGSGATVIHCDLHQGIDDLTIGL